VVVGSLNLDLVCRAPRLPRSGETILGGDVAAIPGGKGANQAVAAARLGGEVDLVGRVGDDDFGRRLLAGLESDGVRAGQVKVTRGAPSGVAMILVDDALGENCIVVSPGANHRLTPEDIDLAEPLIAAAAVVVLQLEVPLAVVRRTMDLCRRRGVPTILDPAPVPPGGLGRRLLGADILTPNLGEALAILAVRGNRRLQPGDIARALLRRGARSVALKLGSRGAMGLEAKGPPHLVKAFKVKAVDTTAAGDAFTGALAVARVEGQPLAEALRFANAAGALCATVPGAQPALPRREAVERLLRKSEVES
jgi:ribokinase